MTALGQLRAQRRPAMRFMLTPLVDVIFLLLTFFMLSSNLSLYAWLTLGQYRQERAAEPAIAAPAAAAKPDLIVVVARDEVRLNGEAVSLAAMPMAVRGLRAGGAASAVVFTRASATVQDVVAVLGALDAAAFASVTVRTGADTPR